MSVDFALAPLGGLVDLFEQPTSFAAASLKYILKVVPFPGALSHVIRLLCLLSIPLTTDKPKPVPRVEPRCFVEKKGSYILERVFSSIPRPVSVIESNT